MVVSYRMYPKDCPFPLFTGRFSILTGLSELTGCIERWWGAWVGGHSGIRQRRERAATSLKPCGGCGVADRPTGGQHPEVGQGL